MVAAVLMLAAVAFGVPHSAQATTKHNDGPRAHYERSELGYYNAGFRSGSRYTFNGRSFTDFDALVRYLRVLFDERDGGYIGRDVSIDIETNDATDIAGNRATLEGSIDFNDSDEATVWFEYGPGSNLKWRTTKVRLDVGNGAEDFARELIGLEDGERYSFRAVGEDEDGDREYGSIESFIADEDRSSSDDDAPEVETTSAEDIDEDVAIVRGEVVMNDFEDGTVFFVYGEDRGMVVDVEDDFDTYADIDESGDDLQKVLVDTNVDDTEDYEYEITGLDSDTTIYFAMGVAYEDEDGDEVIRLGDVRSFTTDE
jgi:hypothetical protein